MIESVATLGRYVLEKSNKSVLEQMIENPNYDYCMFILLSETENGIEFTGVDYEEVSTDYSKYLFRSGSSRGANFSPTAKITTLSNCAASYTALEIIEHSKEKRQQLLIKAKRIKASLQEMGYTVKGDHTPIIPVLIGDAHKAALFAKRLQEIDRRLYLLEKAEFG